MTLEEAIKHAEEVAEEHTKYNRYGGFEGCDECAEEHRQLAEWLKDYKRLLEQQPCEDAISRQAAIGAVLSVIPDDEYWKEQVEIAVNNLPSAQPERKKGRWIPVDSYSAFGGDEATWMAHGNPVAFYYCSECKEQTYAGEDGESLLTDYCPNCGAEDRKSVV